MDPGKVLDSTRIIIKAFVSKESAEALNLEAKGKGISRADLCGEVLTNYLSGPPGSPAAGPDEGLKKALEESQQAREVLQGKVKDLEKSLSDKHQDLEWTRGQLIETQRNLTAALDRIPKAPLLTDGQYKPSWWERLFGRRQDQ
jgi:molybdopterin-binding protein